MNTEVNPNSGTLKGAWDDYISRVKSGDMGALPGVLGLVALCIVFGAMSDVFLTPGNFLFQYIYAALLEPAAKKIGLRRAL